MWTIKQIVSGVDTSSIFFVTKFYINVDKKGKEKGNHPLA